MILTLEMLFSEPRIMNAIIDRTMQAAQDKIRWKRYLKPHESLTSTFTTFYGTTSQVIIGSMIDAHAKKPLRKRGGIGRGVGSVGTFGDAFQMDEARMDLLLELVKKYNSSSTAIQNAVLNEIVNFLTDDYLELILAPMHAIDKMLGDARSRGVYNVNLAGTEYEQIALPIENITASSADLGSFVTWYRNFLEEQADKGKTFKAAQMTALTFLNKVVKSKEFVNTFILKRGAMDINPTSVVTLDMANELISAVGIETPLEIVSERVTLPDGTTYKSFADNVISMLPQDNLGTLEFYKSLRWTDPVPGKVYTQAEGGMVLVSSANTEEGRFLDYQMNAAPNIALPHKMTIIDVSAPLPNSEIIEG